MQDDHRGAIGMAALFDIDLMTVAHVQHALIERLDLRIKVAACAFLSCEPVHPMTI